jgi:hypothetical protein
MATTSFFCRLRLRSGFVQPKKVLPYKQAEDKEIQVRANNLVHSMAILKMPRGTLFMYMESMKCPKILMVHGIFFMERPERNHSDFFCFYFFVFLVIFCFILKNIRISNKYLDFEIFQYANVQT